MRPRKIRRIAAGMAFGAALGAAVVIGAGESRADIDPYIPSPPLWCPGNDPNAFVASGYGGYCEGSSYPDGTRWNTYRVGWFWNPMRCIIPDGTPFPPIAQRGGCGGAWQG